jgi:hypothetical protein
LRQTTLQEENEEKGERMRSVTSYSKFKQQWRRKQAALKKREFARL